MPHKGSSCGSCTPSLAPLATKPSLTCVAWHTSPPGSRTGQQSSAQRARLYEENKDDPQSPSVLDARAIWELQHVVAGSEQARETVVRATIDVPRANMSLNLLLRRNEDATLRASHSMELTFSTPPREPARIVKEVGLPQFKSEEVVRGTPLVGLPVPVKDNLFLIGLSNVEEDRERNLDLLLTRNWVDLPVRFVSGTRAILSFEKGNAGSDIMKQAHATWTQHSVTCEQRDLTAELIATAEGLTDQDVVAQIIEERRAAAEAGRRPALPLPAQLILSRTLQHRDRSAVPAEKH